MSEELRSLTVGDDVHALAEAMTRLGMQVEHIATGCTGLVQPVDVGYNKAF